MIVITIIVQLYCYECTAQASLPMATNEWYFFQHSLINLGLWLMVVM